MIAPARLLVVGCTGFVGRHVVAALRALYPDAALLGMARDGAPVLALDGYASVELGTGDTRELQEALRELAPDVVVNCTGVLTSDAEVAERGNVRATDDLLTCATEYRRGMPFVHVGSSAEYGPGTAGVATREEDAARPTGVYGESKLRATQAVLDAHEEGDVEATVLRLFNVLGSGMAETTLPGKIQRFLLDEHAGDVLHVGDLSAYRDFVDVRDAARAIGQAAQVGAARGRVVNVGSGVARQTRELVDALVGQGRPVRVVEDASGSARSAATSWQAADISTAQKVLGWAPACLWGETVCYTATGEIFGM